jgi:hypothetical protein
VIPSAANTRVKAAGTPSAANVEGAAAVAAAGAGAVAGEGVEVAEARLRVRECVVRR